ncbi:unnamed protein product, partial [marine sediment metagenome]
MKTKLAPAARAGLACLFAWAAIAFVAFAEQDEDQPQAVTLLKPTTQGGMPLMQALNARQSSRKFSDRKLPDQVLSDLLWAAWGVNRPDSGKRTAPSAMN